MMTDQRKELTFTTQELAALRTLLHYWLNIYGSDDVWTVWEDDVTEANEQLQNILDSIGVNGPLYSAFTSLTMHSQEIRGYDPGAYERQENGA